MAHPTRGYSSHTYDITAVHDVDYEKLTLTFSDASRHGRQTVALGVEPTPSAVQIWESVADSISVHGTGMWESANTLNKMVPALRRLIRSLDDRQVNDLAASTVTLAVVRACIEEFDASYKRSMNKLVGRTLRRVHPNGTALATALANTRYVVEESRVELYDDAEADAIEEAARGLFAEAFAGQREIFEALGYDTTGREWLRVPAEEIIEAASARSAKLRGSPQPSGRRPFLEQIDWALLNPDRFAVKERSRIIGQSMISIGRWLYPERDVLVAGAILQCFAEHTGLNLSVILRSHANDLDMTGEDTGMLFTAKARNHSEERVPVRTGSIYSAGGLHEALRGLTRFARHYRRQHLSSDGEVPELVDRFYVEHRSDASASKLVASGELQNGWRSASFDKHWPNRDLDRLAVGLRFQALRRKVLERVLNFDESGDVHGHSERTKIHYLANVLPEHTLTKHAVAAQDSIIDAAIERYTAVADSDDPRAQALSEADDVVDVVVASCANGGNDPDDPERPCSLGPSACFTCPSGYRTVDNVPGLLAAVQLSEIIRDNDPDEWEKGEAASIHFFASESIKQFPTAVIDRVKAEVDLTPHIVDMTSVYTELRR
jgi:hypothetical protein